MHNSLMLRNGAAPSIVCRTHSRLAGGSSSLSPGVRKYEVPDVGPTEIERLPVSPANTAGPRWFFCIARWEQRLAHELYRDGAIPVLIWTQERRKAGMVQLPLLGKVLFFNASWNQRERAARSPAMSHVYEIPDAIQRKTASELAALALASRVNPMLTTVILPAGTRVRINAGTFRDFEGTVIRMTDSRVYLIVPYMGRAVMVEDVDPAHLEPLPEMRERGYAIKIPCPCGVTYYADKTETKCTCPACGRLWNLTPKHPQTPHEIQEADERLSNAGRRAYEHRQ